ncbi:MarR family winged helix-turn-helix transcriptional regulator [Shinella sp. CPCC 101442]|uniref:MarR family winged helix-turn-helix transcriptional regulator n=1 Tax=Shinella sp. CPCC 101442 TaxID=2932265 RepID=UPI0021538479|nr:MarR family winged helix-turn-helix transcriptional regulator [Shinella sp. CPCC 101442]MCR6501681.1 MarR family winged helix-turn-helix transcriptional regulator [Shinella sp. CPCC 101442]
MPSRPDPDSLGFVLIDVARMLRSAFERRIATAGLGLTPGEARTLVRIATLEGSRQLDIAQRMGIEPMTLSTYLDRLQSLGFIERRPDPSDRRAKLIYTTLTAGALISNIRDEQIELMRHVTSGIGEQDLEAMREKLKRLRANLSALEEDSAALNLVKELAQ